MLVDKVNDFLCGQIVVILSDLWTISWPFKLYIQNHIGAILTEFNHGFQRGNSLTIAQVNPRLQLFLGPGEDEFLL